MIPRVTIVGAGLAGATASRLLAESGFQVRLFEARDIPGGNIVDREVESGFYVHQHGPHFFHASDPEIIAFVSRFSKWVDYEHSVLAEVNGLHVPIPVNLNTLEILFEEASFDKHVRALNKHLRSRKETTVSSLLESENQDVHELGLYIFETFFRGYSSKQWGMAAEQVSKSVLGRVPIRSDFDNRYFTDAFQALPVGGYSNLALEMVSHPRINVTLGAKIGLQELEDLDECLVFTGPLDELFEYKLGVLEYRSLRFVHKRVKGIRTQSSAQLNFPNQNRFTRVVDYSLLPNNQASSDSYLVYEYPEPFNPNSNLRYYPIDTAENRELHRAYADLFKEKFNQGFLAGRLANYRYLNMDQAIAQGIKTAKDVVNLLRIEPSKGMIP